MATYAYVHHAGYGRDDHMADELIARAIRQLGGDTGSAIAAHVGLASHPIPAPGVAVYLEGHENKRRMVSAMRRAKREPGVRGCHDCCIAVEAVTRVRTPCDECSETGRVGVVPGWDTGRRCDSCGGRGATYHYETANGYRA